MTEQRDQEWLKTAKPTDVTAALAAGELDELLGRRPSTVPAGDSQLTTEHVATMTPAEISAAYYAGRTNELLGAPVPPPTTPAPEPPPVMPAAPTYSGPVYVPPAWMPTAPANTD